MAITDLTGTTWQLNDGGFTSPYKDIEVTFTSNGQTFNSIIYSAGSNGAYLYFDSTIAWSSTEDGASWANENYRTVVITGGNDVTDSHQISWFGENGTQLKVTNLANTTWTVNAGWEAEAGYGEFDLIFDRYIDGSEIGYEEWYLAVGYSLSADGETTISLLNSVTMYTTISKANVYDNAHSFKLYFYEDGVDNTNPKLIAWLSKYGELQGGEETPAYKFTRLYVGEKVATVGSYVFRKLQTTEYVEEPTYESNFTLADGSILLTADGNVFMASEESGEELIPTEGLAYALSDDGTYYTCTGIGTATDTDIVIASEIDGVPVTSIGYEAFSGCSSLTSVIIPNSITTISDNAFTRCSSLTSMTIGNSVTSIGAYAFYNCVGLTNIIIPNSVTRIGYYAFYRCSSLAEIKFKGTIEQWNAIQKNSYWNSDVPATKVICSDGEVTL